MLEKKKKEAELVSPHSETSGDNMCLEEERKQNVEGNYINVIWNIEKEEQKFRNQHLFYISWFHLLFSKSDQRLQCKCLKANSDKKNLTIKLDLWEMKENLKRGNLPFGTRRKTDKSSLTGTHFQLE